MPTPKTLVVALGLAVCGAVRAGELCVSCSEPDATYRCETQGFTAGDARADVACITELAKTEGHKRCGVNRRQAEPCDGPLRIVRRDLLSDPPKYGPVAPTGGAEDATAPAAPDAPSSQKPTVAGELKKAGDATGDAIGAASRAVGSAAQNAWKCMMSLWTDC